MEGPNQLGVDLNDVKAQDDIIAKEIHLVKNFEKGPCTAVISGMNYNQSECVIVYPADDFENHNILEQNEIKLYE